MDAAARLTTVERNPDVQAVAKKHLGEDRRVTFILGDGADYLRAAPAASVDFLFADGGAGKGRDLDLGLRVVAPGGIYIGDDLRQHLLQDNGRAERMRAFEAALQARPDFAVVKLDWSSGVILAARRG
jgi:predicted O-methyltransferase YrrM